MKLMRRTYRYLIISVVILSFLIPQPVYGLTQTLNPTSTDYIYYPFGDDGSWTIGLGTVRGGIQDTLSAVYVGWTMQNYSASNTINSVKIQWTTSNVPIWHYGRVYPFVRIGGVNYVDWAGYSASGSYTWATNPATGMAWTTSGINNAQWGLYAWPTTWGQCNIGSCNIEVDYTLTVPTVTTSSATSIVYSGASHNVTLNGAVTDDGGADITQVGFVYGTSSNATSPGNITPAGTGYGNTVSATYTSYGENSFTWLLGSLTECTQYYYRAFACNSQGYAYGSEVNFKTLCTPTITTLSATSVSTTTARINAQVTLDGGQAADVRFSYNTTSASSNCTAGASCTLYSCNASAYATSTAWVEDTYTTGQTPYVDLSGLSAGTTYYVCAQVRNDVGCACGGEISFTTTSGVSEPTDFQGIPSSTSVSLSWTKGTGAQYTLIRYKQGSYPTSTSDGTQAYYDTQTSTIVTGLSPGTSYYFMAWGRSGAFTSTSNATLMLTTTAAVDEAEDLPQPPTPDMWWQAPSHNNMSAVPFYSIVNFAFECFEVPLATGWYWIALVFCAACGVLFYSGVPNANLPITVAVVFVAMFMCVIVGLIPGWQLVPVGILAAVGFIFGERR